MFCTNCGTKVEDGAVFCINCGTRLTPVTAPAETPVMEKAEEAAPIANAVNAAAEMFPAEPAPAAEEQEDDVAAEVAEAVEKIEEAIPEVVPDAEPVPVPVPVKVSNPVTPSFAPIPEQRKPQPTASAAPAVSAAAVPAVAPAEKPVPTWLYVLMILVMNIPVVGLITHILTLAFAKRRSFKNYSRAVVILKIIAIVLTIAAAAVLMFVLKDVYEDLLDELNGVFEYLDLGIQVDPLF